MDELPGGKTPDEDFVFLGAAHDDVGLFADLCHPGGETVANEGVEYLERPCGAVDADNLHGLVFGPCGDDAAGLGASPPDLVVVGAETGNLALFAEIE